MNLNILYFASILGLTTLCFITGLPIMLIFGLVTFILICNLNPTSDIDFVNFDMGNLISSIQLKDFSFELSALFLVLTLVRITSFFFEEVAFKNGTLNKLPSSPKGTYLFQIGLVFAILDSNYFLRVFSSLPNSTISTILAFFSNLLILIIITAVGFNLFVFSSSYLNENKHFFVERIISKVGISLLVLILYGFILRAISEDSLSKLIF